MRRLILVAVMLLLAACEATVSPPQASLDPNTPVAPFGTPPTSTSPTETRVPTNTPQPIPPSVTPVPTAAFSAEPTSTEILVTLSPLLDTDVVPPLRVNLPFDWTLVSDAIMLPGLDQTDVLPFGYYSGPVSGGKGVITVLYGFQSIVPQFGGQTANVYSDALRLLLFTVIEPSCEYSFEDERTYSIGGRAARGTIFAADQCPEGLPSVRGWFAALNVDGLNFAFYAYTEPLEALNDMSRSQLQAILNSIEFDFSLLPTAVPSPAATP